MVTSQIPNIQIYNCANSTYIVEFINQENTKVIGHLKTNNKNAVKRIYSNTRLPYDLREVEAELKILGFTLFEAYDALEYEFINQ